MASSSFGGRGSGGERGFNATGSADDDTGRPRLAEGRALRETGREAPNQSRQPGSLSAPP